MSTQKASQMDNFAESSALPFLENLLCPKCCDANSSLRINNQSLQCDSCEAEFPLLNCEQAIVPWLFEQPELTRHEWQARLNGFLHLNQLEQQRLKDGLKDKRISKTSQKRMTKLLNAKKQQIEQVFELIKSLGLSNNIDQSLNDVTANYQSKTPKSQGLDSYYNNIFRDWAWDNSENDQMLAAIETVFDADIKLGNVLTIGAGAGRLSYDVHKKYSANYSLLLDINPVLLFAGCKAIQGESFHLNEFPTAPMNKNMFFAEQKCEAPTSNQENIYYLFADGMNPPVKANSFDTVITPWLLDIIPQNLRDYIPRINQCIQVGGSWLNVGSLAFFHKQQSWCYSEEEVIELIEKSGFELVEYKRSAIKYMQSPLSAHGRTESVFSFHAKKVKNVVVPPKYEYLPNWIRNSSIPIPKSYEQELDSSKHLLQAQVLSAIDGVRSVEQIGELVAKQYNLDIGDATHAVRRILINHYEGQ